VRSYNGWALMQLLIGEGRVIGPYAQLTTNPPNTSGDWQVSMICAGSAWSVSWVRTPEQRAQVEQALAKIPDDLFATWYFKGSSDAQTAIKKQLPTF
jgi:hypothetical protein